MSHNVVCVSRASGADGEEIGRLVADRLGFLYVDEEVINLAATRAGIDPEQVADEERRKPLFAGLLDHLGDGGSQAVLSTPPATPELPSEAVRTFIRDAIQEVAARGAVVIVAHAASYAVGTERRPLRVFVTASRETRARRLGAAEGLEALEATRLISRRLSKALLRRCAGASDPLRPCDQHGRHLRGPGSRADHPSRQRRAIATPTARGYRHNATQA
jgi:hypothetical protein